MPQHRRMETPSQNEQTRGVYPELVTDATVVNAIYYATKGVADKGVRDALQSGFHSAIQALQKRVGDVASITLEEEAIDKAA